MRARRIADAERVRRAYFRDAAQPLMVLEDFAAAKYGRLTQGGDVLFSTNPAQPVCRRSRIRAMRYNSDKAGDKFSDLKSFEGPAAKRIFEEAYSFHRAQHGQPVSRFHPGQPQAAGLDALPGGRGSGGPDQRSGAPRLQRLLPAA
jgi:ATP-dependent DNA helicase RecG